MHEDNLTCTHAPTCDVSLMSHRAQTLQTVLRTILEVVSSVAIKGRRMIDCKLVQNEFQRGLVNLEW